MTHQEIHPADQELLLYADGELPWRSVARVRAHLAACWGCRSRMAEIEHTIADFMAFHETLNTELPPPAAGRRALLKARLHEAAQSAARVSWWGSLSARSFASVCAIALLLGLGIAGVSWRVAAPRPGAKPQTNLLPNPRLTPGVTTAAGIAAICSAPHDEVVRPVSAALRQKVFQEYGLRVAQADDYEVDYLISPGLGGADDLKNLWPQPRYDTAWNSFAKDRLEEYLHESVCSGKVDLATAQNELARDWISAYKKHFQASERVTWPARAFSGASALWRPL
jgi:anti-sigma factor RsiW